MQDVQNIPNPDVEPNDADEEFGSHSQVEQDLDNDDIEQVDDADDIPQERDVDNGIEQIPNDKNDRTSTEQIPDVGHH